jgi:monofunctional biosynthetic peptidoglycan transglycosylase
MGLCDWQAMIGRWGDGRAGGSKIQGVSLKQPSLETLRVTGEGQGTRTEPVPATKRRGRWRWVWRVFVALVAVAVAFHGWIYWQVWRLRTENPQQTAFMQQGLARLRQQNPKAALQHRWVAYERISPHLKRAVIAAEDQKFLDHAGFDLEEIEKAFEKNQKRQRVVRGASTISQQLAKNLFLAGERAYWRKAEEAILTVMIERTLEKRRILEIYLNVIEWGNGIYGAEAAARQYYAKSAAELGPEEAARLAAMIPNPRFYYRRGVTPYLEQQTEFLLQQMQDVRTP